MKKLVAREYIVTEEIIATMTGQWKVGDRFSYLFDPETDKVYMPKDGFVVTGENLEELFFEVE